MKFLKIKKFFFFFDMLKSSYIIFVFNAVIFLMCIGIEIHELLLYTDFKKEVEDGPFKAHVVSKRFARPTQHNGLIALYFARALEMLLYVIHITASIAMIFYVARKSTRGIPVFLVSSVVSSVIVFVKGVLGYYECEWIYSSFYVAVALVNVYFVLCIPQIAKTLGEAKP